MQNPVVGPQVPILDTIVDPTQFEQNGFLETQKFDWQLNFALKSFDLLVQLELLMKVFILWFSGKNKFILFTSLAPVLVESR